MTKTILRLSCASLALAPFTAFATEASSTEPAIAAATTTLAAAAGTAVHEPEGDTIIVTASPIERNAEALLSPVSVLEGEELQRQLRDTLGETLRREPGVSSTNFGAGASRPIIRGLGGGRVRTLINGIGSIDAAAASPDHATPIEPALAETIEVVRGTGLLRYGSSASGGVVNVLDGRIASEVPEDGFDIAGRYAFTSVDEGSTGSAGAQVHLGKLGGVDVVATGQAITRRAGDYDISGFAESEALMEAEDDHDDHGMGHDDEEEVEGVLENSFNEVDSLTGGLSFVGERGFLGFAVQNYRSRYGVPGHGHGHEEEHGAGEEHDEEEEGVFIDLDQTRYDINGSLAFGGPIQRVDLYAGFADYEHIEFEAPGEPGTVFANEGYEIRVEAVQAERGDWRGASGIQIRDRKFSAIGEEAFVPPTETEQLGLYTFQETKLGPVTVEGSLRYEETDQAQTVNNIERSFEGVSGALGGSIPVADGVRATFNLFRTERAPTSDELFSDGPHLATESFDIGDVNLDIETALGLEGGLRFAGERGSFSINAFYTEYSDFIFQQATGQTGEDILIARGETDPEELEEFAELTVFQYTQADATFSGLEIEGQLELGQASGFDVSADLVADFVNAELDRADAQGNTQLPRIPPLGVLVGLEADNGTFSFRAEAEHSAEADDVASFELPTDSFTLVNLYADWRVTENISLSLAGLNIGDEEARVHTSFLKDQAPLPGRNIRFALNMRY
ncbi:TonB-dependent receptor [Parvularcula lutaonensis]|uniref:TonB-dependent receptor n=1 Tax=Parvularcula lutaonensis TaxID=491923 RepID=A0ABV7MBG5_9PROT|nr:TonB-dependent receptor [Parvularcula lutaonensis]GGY47166.1 TonB-dependent receptor [Parvularcula lutaonensis]